nr:hypothetical protein CFP56_04022 [Quercus suber]
MNVCCYLQIVLAILCNRIGGLGSTLVSHCYPMLMLAFEMARSVKSVGNKREYESWANMHGLSYTTYKLGCAYGTSNAAPASCATIQVPNHQLKPNIRSVISARRTRAENLTAAVKPWAATLHRPRNNLAKDCRCSVGITNGQWQRDARNRVDPSHVRWCDKKTTLETSENMITDNKLSMQS